MILNTQDDHLTAGAACEPIFFCWHFLVDRWMDSLFKYT